MDTMSRAIEVVAAEMWSLRSECISWEELVLKDANTATHFRNKAFGLIHRAGLTVAGAGTTDRSFKDFLISTGGSR